MDLFIKGKPEIIKPIEESKDKAIVILPTVGKRGESTSNIVKEITAMDALMIGPSAAAIINGVPQSSASKFKDGKDIADDDVRARVLSKKHNIQDVAVTKLMETLELLEPTEIVRPRDQIALLGGLGRLVEQVSDKGTNVTAVQIHFYSPNQKKETDYEVIEA